MAHGVSTPNSNILRKVVVLNPQGADGSAAATYSLNLGKAAILRSVAIDYGASQNSSTTVTLKAENSSGDTIFASGATNTNTTNAATGQMVSLVTDGYDGSASGQTANTAGIPIAKSLYIAVASANGSPTNNKPIRIVLFFEMNVRHYLATLNCVGTNGSATATQTIDCRRPGLLRHVKVTYGSGATTGNLTIKTTDKGENTGATIFSNASADSNLARGTVDGAGVNASNSTKSHQAGGAVGFQRKLVVGATSQNKCTITVEIWVSV